LSDFDLEPFDVAPTAISLTTSGSDFAAINVTDPTGRTRGFCGMLTIDTGGGYIQFDAEL